MNRIAPRAVTIDIDTLPSLHPAEDESRAPKIAKITDDPTRTALSGDFGRLLCIGYVDEDSAGGHGP